MAEETDRIGRLTLKRLAPEEQRRVRTEISDKLRRLGDAKGPEMNEAQLHQAAVDLTVRLAEVMTREGNTGGGYVHADELAALESLVLISKNATGRKYRRIVSHELSHHLMHDWVAPALYGVDEVVCTRQDNYAMRERIAKGVEDDLTE